MNGSMIGALLAVAAYLTGIAVLLWRVAFRDVDGDWTAADEASLAELLERGR